MAVRRDAEQVATGAEPEQVQKGSISQSTMTQKKVEWMTSVYLTGRHRMGEKSPKMKHRSFPATKRCFVFARMPTSHELIGICSIFE